MDQIYWNYKAVSKDQTDPQANKERKTKVTSIQTTARTFNHDEQNQSDGCTLYNRRFTETAHLPHEHHDHEGKPQAMNAGVLAAGTLVIRNGHTPVG